MATILRRFLSVALALMLLCGCTALGEEEEELILFTEEELVFDDLSESSEGEEEEFIIDDLPETLEEINFEIDDTVNPDDLELNRNLPDHVVNILLIGIDSRSRDMEEGLQHNDVNIIVSINTKDGSIKLTSLLRDTYLTIPGLKSKQRINVAYSRTGGGKRLLVQYSEIYERCCVNVMHTWIRKKQGSE